MFRRRKGSEPSDVADVADDVAGIEGADGVEDDGVDDDEVDDLPRPAGRPNGPWDVDDAPSDGLVRLDLGALRVPGVDGGDVQVNLDEATGQVMAVTVVVGDSALQLQAFAAPRTEATWAQVRKEIAAQITGDGGLADVDQETGDLRAQLPFPQPDGSVSLGAVRFVGVDGPRWLLRGVLSGRAAADTDAAGPLLEALRGVVVVRGNSPFAPGDPLPLRLPDDLVQPGEEPGDDRDPLGLEGPGPTITEIR